MLNAVEKARKVLKDMMATDPTNLELPTQLAKLEVNTGNYDNAEKIVLDILKRATSRPDSIRAWNYLIQAYAQSGRVQKALDELAAYERFISQDVPANVTLGQNLLTKVGYVARLENPVPKVERYLEELSAYGGNYFEAYTCYAYLYLIQEGRAVSTSAARITDCKDHIASTGKAGVAYYELAKLKLEERYEEAADAIDQRLASGTEVIQPINYIGLQRLAGRLERAAELLEEQLVKQPNDPRLLLEKARILVAKGESDPAAEILRGVLKAWRNADADHLESQEAAALAERLGVSIPG